MGDLFFGNGGVFVFHDGLGRRFGDRNGGLLRGGCAGWVERVGGNIPFAGVFQRGEPDRAFIRRDGGIGRYGAAVRDRPWEQCGNADCLAEHSHYWRGF